jgi:hypothetical protein
LAANKRESTRILKRGTKKKRRKICARKTRNSELLLWSLHREMIWGTNQNQKQPQNLEAPEKSRRVRKANHHRRSTSLKKS